MNGVLDVVHSGEGFFEGRFGGAQRATGAALIGAFGMGSTVLLVGFVPLARPTISAEHRYALVSQRQQLSTVWFSDSYRVDCRLR